MPRKFSQVRPWVLTSRNLPKEKNPQPRAGFIRKAHVAKTKIMRMGNRPIYIFVLYVLKTASHTLTPPKAVRKMNKALQYCKEKSIF